MSLHYREHGTSHAQYTNDAPLILLRRHRSIIYFRGATWNIIAHKVHAKLLWPCQQLLGKQFLGYRTSSKSRRTQSVKFDCQAGLCLNLTICWYWANRPSWALWPVKFVPLSWISLVARQGKGKGGGGLAQQGTSQDKLNVHTLACKCRDHYTQWW